MSTQLSTKFLQVSTPLIVRGLSVYINDNEYWNRIAELIQSLPTIKMQSAVKILSVLGIAAHILFFLACFASSGLSDTSSQNNFALIPILMPFLYFGFCFLTSVRRFNVLFLLCGGVIAHIIIVPFYYRAIRDGMGFLAIIPIVLSCCWLLMCFRRDVKI